jgi:hypothetical protein
MKRSPLKRKSRLNRVSRSRARRARASKIEKAMRLYRGRPCAICGTTRGTVGHHIESRQRRPDLIDKLCNIIALCPDHHLYSNVMSAHGPYEAMRRFETWLSAYRLGSN